MDDEKTMVLTGDGIDTSQYYVVRKGEYDDMRDEIERLRAVGDAILSAFRHLTISGELGTLMKAREAFDAWEKARLGIAGDSTQHLATCVGFPTEARRG